LAERRELRSLGLARPDLNRLTSKSSSMSGGCHLRKTASSGGPALGLRSPSTVRNDSSDTWRVGQPGTVVPVASRSTATSAWFRGLDAAEGELLIVASRVSRSPCRAVAGARSRAHSQSSSVAVALMCRWAAMTWLRAACAPTGGARTPGGRGSDRSPGEPLLYPSPTTRRPRSLRARPGIPGTGGHGVSTCPSPS